MNKINELINKEKLKALNNFQLVQLLNYGSLNREHKQIIENELTERNISQEELDRLKLKLNLGNKIQERESQDIPPFLSPFLLNYHFKKIASLKATGNIKAAMLYELKLYAGLIIYAVIVVLILLYVKK